MESSGLKIIIMGYLENIFSQVRKKGLTSLGEEPFSFWQLTPPTLAARTNPVGRNAAAKLQARAIECGVKVIVILPRLADFKMI